MFRHIVLVALTCLMLVGCGGLWGGGGSGGGNLLHAESTSVTLDLGRGGTSIDISTLKIETSGAMSPVSAAGTASVTIFNGGPQFSTVSDAQGRPVMYGMLSTAERTLSARSTAKTVAYLGLGGAWKKSLGRSIILNELQNLSGFDNLVAAVQQVLDTEGYFNAEAPAYQQALTNFLSNAMTQPNGVIVEPTGASGLSIDTSVEGKLSVQNVFLRRVALYLRKTGYKNAENQVVEDTNSPWVKQEMPLVARYSGLTATISGLLQNQVPYSPVSSAPAMDIPVSPQTAKETYYELRALGPGVLNGPVYDQLTPDQLSDLRFMEVKALFLDVFLVLAANAVVPLSGDEVDDYLQFVGSNAAVTDFINTIISTMPQVHALLVEGEYWQAAKLLSNSTLTSNTILPWLSELTVQFIDRNSNLSDAGFDRINNSFSSVLKAMGLADAMAYIGDVTLLYGDFLDSKRAEKFAIRVTPGKVTLVAGATTLRPPTGTTSVTAIIQDKDPNGTYEYRWETTPRPNYWVEDRHLEGTDDAANGILITAESQVTLRTLVPTAGAAEVKCTVLRLDGGRREVGDASVTVTFVPFEDNRIITRHDAFQYMAGGRPSSIPGRWEAIGGVYIDLPRTLASRQYQASWIWNGSSQRSFSAQEPLTVNEFGMFETHQQFAGGQPNGVMRLWVYLWTGTNNHRSEEEARAAAVPSMEVWRNQARNGPITLVTVLNTN